MQRLFLKMHKNFIFSFKMHKNLIWMYKICSDKIKIAWSSIFKSFKKNILLYAINKWQQYDKYLLIVNNKINKN